MPFYLRADAYAYPIKLPKNMQVYSIEKFINTEINCSEVKEFITCGFPKLASRDKKANLTASPVISKQSIVGGDYCQRLIYEEYDAYDTINYAITMTRETVGYSGSPVYIIYRNKIFFGGLFSLGVPNDAPIGNTALIVRPEYVLDKLH